MKRNRRLSLFVRILAAITLVVFTGMLGACSKEAQPATEQTAIQATEAAKPAESVDVVDTSKPAESNMELATKYITLLFPKTFQNDLQHQEIVEGDAAMEIFTMAYRGTELELFRIYFGDETTGTVLGYLTVADKELPVAYTTCEYDDNEFPDTDAKDLYSQMMDAFSVVLNTISEDNRFSMTRSVKPVDYEDLEMKYWSVSLPEYMSWEEREENGVYFLDFYGTIHEDRIPLYTISLGETATDRILGNFAVDGVQKPVGIVTHGIMPGEDWSEENMAEAYQAMETIDLVIQAIMASENFSQ